MWIPGDRLENLFKNKDVLVTLILNGIFPEGVSINEILLFGLFSGKMQKRNFQGPCINWKI